MVYAVWSLLAIQSATAQQIETVVPRCRPGYRDVTSGKAYPWSCSFHCPGGNYATANCQCACLNDEQIERLRSQGIEIQNGPVSVPSRRPNEILVPPPAEPTFAPSDPVLEVPVGGLEGSTAVHRPLKNASFVATDGEAPATTGKATQSGRTEPGNVAQILAVMTAACLIGASVAIVGMAFRHGCFSDTAGGRKNASQPHEPKAKSLPGALPLPITAFRSKGSKDVERSWRWPAKPRVLPMESTSALESSPPGNREVAAEKLSIRDPKLAGHKVPQESGKN